VRRSSTRHKHNIIHGHTKPTKTETRKVPAGDKVGIATHNKLMVREVAHARKRNPLSDLNKILHGGKHPRRNHFCQFWRRSVKGLRGGGGLKFALLHWLWSSPLQHSRTTVRVCDHFIQCHIVTVSHICHVGLQLAHHIKQFKRQSKAVNSVISHWPKRQPGIERVQACTR